MALFLYTDVAWGDGKYTGEYAHCVLKATQPLEGIRDTVQFLDTLIPQTCSFEKGFCTITWLLSDTKSPLVTNLGVSGTSPPIHLDWASTGGGVTSGSHFELNKDGEPVKLSPHNDMGGRIWNIQGAANNNKGNPVEFVMGSVAHVDVFRPDAEEWWLKIKGGSGYLSEEIRNEELDPPSIVMWCFVGKDPIPQKDIDVLQKWVVEKK